MLKDLNAKKTGAVIFLFLAELLLFGAYKS